ncbi:vacuolar alkaline phosphatase [Collariella sp. IMI 366227]|nr:vacuolar alkaline phosphatase [Collariella sp. IMI 366227]
MSPRSERTPLLADHHPRTSEDSLRRAEEEDAALHGGTVALAPRRTSGLREPTPPPLPTPVAPSDPSTGGPYISSSKKKRNLIFMVSDGMGPASLSLTRSFRQFTSSLPIDDVLTLDSHFWGTSRTRSTNSLVTDSAAGATAFSCGRKSYNGAISMLPGHRPCGTVLEAAKRKGFATGLVVTTDVTDATPACFAAHVDWRMQNDEIALQEVGEGPLGRSVDLILGGDRAGFDELGMGKNVTLPMLGLFAAADVPFEIDRRNMADVYPSLSEMAITALTALEEATKDSEEGFFLMIEGSRIDHAGHINDPAAQVREVLEYDKTFKIVLDFLEKSDTEGILVATSDHETGGLATAWQAPNELPVYNWHPAILAKANASAEYCSVLLRQHIAASPLEPHDALIDWINSELVVRRLGIPDAIEIELNALATNPFAAVNIFAKMVSMRARVGWSTHGHSAVDVNIYSSGGVGAEKIRGNVENTDIGRFLAAYLDVDVEEITKELEDKLKGEEVLDDMAVDEAGVGMRGGVG